MSCMANWIKTKEFHGVLRHSWEKMDVHPPKSGIKHRCWSSSPYLHWYFLKMDLVFPCSNMLNGDCSSRPTRACCWPTTATQTEDPSWTGYDMYHPRRLNGDKWDKSGWLPKNWEQHSEKTSAFGFGTPIFHWKFLVYTTSHYTWRYSWYLRFLSSVDIASPVEHIFIPICMILKWSLCPTLRSGTHT